MPSGNKPERSPDEHQFIVTAVRAADVEGFFAATLLDIRGGRVTLCMDETCAKLLRDLLNEQLP